MSIKSLSLLAPMPLTAGYFQKRKYIFLSSSLVDDHYIVQKILRFLRWACNNCFLSLTKKRGLDILG